MGLSSTRIFKDNDEDKDEDQNDSSLLDKKKKKKSYGSRSKTKADQDKLDKVLDEARPPLYLAPHPSPASPVANRGWAPLMDGVVDSADLDQM